MPPSPPARLRESPWRLLRRTVGDARAIAGKLYRLAYALWYLLAPRGERQRRLERARSLGYLETFPKRTQLIAGSIDMFRFFIIPAADDYYRSKHFSFGFHQLLRFLDDPASMIDATGLSSHPDAIIGHVMQVVHADPVYDLQLLRCVAPDDAGLAELERQCREMVEGRHPRQASIGAIVEDPQYHARLLDYVVAFRRDPDRVEPMLRANVVHHPELADIARTFGSFPTTMRYFHTLPRNPLRAAWHILRSRSFHDPSRESTNDPHETIANGAEGGAAR
ncbi:MAG: hypothetical protein B7733_08850 [Myxococcales bacterium FL481]|nr:MAG: hypothetical protein B7733_08850 [Myxococcales bacterium FL481]